VEGAGFCVSLLIALSLCETPKKDSLGTCLNWGALTAVSRAIQTNRAPAIFTVHSGKTYFACIRGTISNNTTSTSIADDACFEIVDALVHDFDLFVDVSLPANVAFPEW